MPSDTHPMYVSRELVRQLREDPVASAQLREHMRADELIDLVGLRADDMLDWLWQYHAPELMAFAREKDPRD